MFKEVKDFYPTPKSLIEKMCSKLDSLRDIKYILEPSAGKGNLIEGFKDYYSKDRYVDRNKVDKFIKFDCIEKDDNLSNLLKGKGYNIIFDDFLEFQPDRYYDLIIMNPPFINGAEHLLKALRVQERIGGYIVCLLNAETLKNQYSNNRKHLCRLLDEYDADIEYIQNGFSDAERSTDVEIALVSVNVPMADNKTMFEKEFKKYNPDIEIEDMNAVAKTGNKLETLIQECEIIKKSGISLFKEKMKIDKLLEGVGVKSELHITNKTTHAERITINDFISDTNLTYWRKMIDETDLKNRLPSKLRENFSYNIIKKQEDIDFNKENVMYFYKKLMNEIPKSYEETVAAVFDKLTSKHSYSEKSYNKTIHYYDGWKSNDAFKINFKGKVIIPVYRQWYFKVPDTLVDLNIIFENISGEKYNILEDKEVVKGLENYERNIDTPFFKLSSYKKNTLHIKFKDEKYLQQFNVLASKGKNWLPDSFGKKTYSDMTEDEKQAVRNFGLDIEEYNKLACSHNNDYLRLASGE